MQSAAAAAERVFELLKQKKWKMKMTRPERLKNVKGYVDFEHVKIRL